MIKFILAGIVQIALVGLLVAIGMGLTAKVVLALNLLLQ